MELEGFEYTQLRELAKSDPVAFDKEVVRLVDTMIDSCPEARQKFLCAFQTEYEKRKKLLSDEVWFLQYTNWMEKSPKEVVSEVKKCIASMPEKITEP